MGNSCGCCLNNTHLIFALGTNDSFLKALNQIEIKCNRKDNIIILWTGSPALDEDEPIEWSKTSHNTRASTNQSTYDVHTLIHYYQNNGWNLNVIVCNKEITRGFSVSPDNGEFICKDRDGFHNQDNDRIFTNLCKTLYINDISLDYLNRTPVSSRTQKPRGSYCSDIKTVAMLFMYMCSLNEENNDMFETESRYLRSNSFQEKGELPLYYKGRNSDSIDIIKFNTSKYSSNSDATDAFDNEFLSVLMLPLFFYQDMLPINTSVMAICTDLGDPYNESGDVHSLNLVNDFDDLVAIAMISCLEGDSKVYTTMKDKNIERIVSLNVENLIDHLEVTPCNFHL